MSLIAVTGVKGSPGTTTATIALAAVWPTRPLLADCDPAGGDIALRVPLPDATATSGGLLAFAADLRHGQHQPVWPHVRRAAGGLDVLTGLDGSEQAVAIGAGWTAIADGLARLDDGDDTDVLADVGRLTADSLGAPLLDRADLVVVVTRARVGMLVHLRRELRRLGANRPRAMAVLVVADLRETAAVRDTQRAVETSGAPGPIPVLGPLVPDRDVVSTHRGVRLDRGLLVRTARALSPQLHALATRERTPEAAHGR